MERANFRVENDILYLYISGGRMICPRYWRDKSHLYDQIRIEQPVLNIWRCVDGTEYMIVPYIDLLWEIETEQIKDSPCVKLVDGDLESMKTSLRTLEEQWQPVEDDQFAHIFQYDHVGGLLRAPAVLVDDKAERIDTREIQIGICFGKARPTNPFPLWVCYKRDDQNLDSGYRLYQGVGDEWREYDGQPIQSDYWIERTRLAVQPDWERPPTFWICMDWAPLGYTSLYSGHTWGIWIWKPVKK